MKRLLAQIGLTYLFVLIVVFYLGIVSAFVLLFVFLLLFLFFLIVKKYRKTIYLPTMAAVAFIACLVNILYTNLVYEKTIDTYADTDTTVTATLKQKPYKNYGSYYYRFTATSSNSKPCNFDFILQSGDSLDLDVYDVVDMHTTFTVSDFNYNKSNGVYLTTADFTEGFSMTVRENTNKPFMYNIAKLRDYASKALDSSLSPEAAALSKAVLIGDKYALDNQTRSSFVRAGVSYLIVVSGLHFSMLFSCLLLISQHIVRVFRKTRFILYPLMIVLAIIYMLFTGMSPSVIRSGIMFIMYPLSLMLSRDTYSMNSLGLAAISVSIGNPYFAGNIGLILSFSSTVFIIVFAPLIYEKISLKVKKKNVILGVFLKLFSVQISTLPVSVILSIVFFRHFSTVSLFSGFVLYFPIWLVLMSALLISLLYCIPFLSFLIPLLSFVSQLSSSFIYSVTSFISKLPFSYISVTDGYVYLWILFTAVLSLTALIYKHKERIIPLLALSSFLIFLTGFLSNAILSYSIAELNIYDIGGGRAVTLSTADTQLVLDLECDSSTRTQAIRKISSDLSGVDFCSSVENTKKSEKTLEKLSEEFAINTVLMYDTDVSADLGDCVENLVELQDTTTIYPADNLKLKYTKVVDKFIITAYIGDTSLLILPDGVDLNFAPKSLCSADIIILSDICENMELLSCDTLIISAESYKADTIMKYSCGISNNTMLTCDSDIKLKPEV